MAGAKLTLSAVSTSQTAKQNKKNEPTTTITNRIGCCYVREDIGMICFFSWPNDRIPATIQSEVLVIYTLPYDPPKRHGLSRIMYSRQMPKASSNAPVVLSVISLFDRSLAAAITFESEAPSRFSENRSSLADGGGVLLPSSSEAMSVPGDNAGDRVDASDKPSTNANGRDTTLSVAPTTRQIQSNKQTYI